MLKDFIHTDAGRRRHLETPIGPYLDGYLQSRLGRGFAKATVRTDLLWATAFGEYLAEADLRQLDDVDESTLSQFVQRYQARPRRTGMKRRVAGGSTSLAESAIGSVRALLAYLREVDAVPAPPPPTNSYAAVLDEYLSFLRHHRGFADITVEQHRRWSRAFLGRLARDRRSQSLAQLSVGDVESIVLELADGIGHRSRQIMTTSVEALIKYLRGAGHVPPTCHPFLPRTRRYALSSLPSVIAAEEVERALEGIDRTTTMGLRDYAMVRLVATYGLRASEAVTIQLDDIDWRREILHVRQSKTRRGLTLPLLDPVRDALIAYLRGGRPETSSRTVFMKCHAPRGPMTRAALYAVVRKALKRAGVAADHYGPHALRHARASSLLRRGHSLKTIGDLLGHRVPEATLIYCKVDVDTLRTVAIDVPEVRA